MKATTIGMYSFLLIAFCAGFFALALPVAAYGELTCPRDCANGHTMTANELYNAILAGKVTTSFSNAGSQSTITIHNSTNCSAPVVLASYKVFIEPTAPGWLNTQEFIAESLATNINANGNTIITVPIAQCRTQIDCWYGWAPHQLYDNGNYGSPTNPSGYAFAASFSSGNLCTHCTSHSTKQCVENSVYWFNSCGAQEDLYQACTSTQTCQSGQCVNLQIVCSSNPECGTSGYVGSPYCQGNAVYQDYKTYTCNNPGTPSSYCSSSTSGQLKQTCASNQVCQGGQCVISCIPNYTKQCAGNAVYWFDSCGVQGALYQGCTTSQICSYGQCMNINCSTASDCGTNGYVGSPYCQGNAVYQDYKTYTCNNPGTTSSYCSNSTSAQLKNTCTANQTCQSGSCVNQTINCSTNADCGTNAYVGSPFCQGNAVYQNYKTYTCNNPGTSTSYCSDSTAAQKKNDCTSNQICTNGSCTNQTINCSTNSDCGTNSYTGSPYCQGNSVYQNYITYTCNNAGTSTSYCSSSTASQLKTTCSGSQTCSNGSCNNQNITCTSNSECGTNGYTGSPYCQGNNVYQNYITYTCNNAGTSTSYCSSSTNSQLKDTCSSNQTCSNGSCSGQNCTWHSYQQCSGNYLYWYDSCGNQQDSQYCQNGCYNNTCQNYNYNNCTYHAYKLCVGNNVYWFNSCGNQQDFYQSCSGSNMTCQYGQCAYYNPVPPTPPYIAHYYISCNANNLYWYDSRGAVNTLYRTCADSNSCTIDSCSSKNCSNLLKCDGSTCAQGSVDYTNYCGGTNPQNPIDSLSISFLAKENNISAQYGKSVQIGQNSTVYFMVSLINTSSSAINNIGISSNIPGQIVSIGNLQIDGQPASGEIISGISVASLLPNSTKTITFEGKTLTFISQATAPATATLNVSGSIKSESLSITFNPSSGSVAGVSTSSFSSGIWGFLKRWYLWIIVGLILLFLFVVVFRRLSSNS